MPTTEQDERAGLSSASGMEKRYNCAGSQQAEAGLPELQSESFTKDGDEIHASLETGEVLEDEDKANIARRISEMEKRAVDEWHEQFGLDRSKTTCSREERLWIRERGTLNPIASAKLDVHYMNGNHALAIDAKTGYIEATSSHVNTQLRIQALALWHEYPNLLHIRVAIAQCRFKSRFDACDYAVKDLQSAEGELMLALWKAKQPNATRNPGTWCRYCRAKNGHCLESAAYSMFPVAAIGIGAVAQIKKADVVVRVNQMSLQDLAIVHSRASIATNVIEAVKERLKNCTAEELATVGLQLVDGGNTREVTDAQKLLGILHAKGLASAEEFRSWIKVSLGDMEEVLVKRMAESNQGTQKAAKEELKSLIEPVITLKPKSKQLKQI